jgi:hypothetical protein
MAMWADNNIVTTLSNCHSPNFLKVGDGVMRRKRNLDKSRDQHQSAVKIPEQTKAYTRKFFKIDHRNLKDAKYDLKGQSKKHNWSPKLGLRFFNVNTGNASLYYQRLCALYTPDRRIIPSRERMAALAHTLCQRGSPMRSCSVIHPPVYRNMACVFNGDVGKKMRMDAQGMISRSVIPTQGSRASRVLAAVAIMKANRYRQQKRSPWRKHQSVACERRGRCTYSKCPCRLNSTAEERRSANTNMRCEECSIECGRDIFLCNGIKGKVQGSNNRWEVSVCHLEFHKLMFNNK